MRECDAGSTRRSGVGKLSVGYQELSKPIHFRARKISALTESELVKLCRAQHTYTPRLGHAGLILDDIVRQGLREDIVSNHDPKR